MLYIITWLFEKKSCDSVFRASPFDDLSGFYKTMFKIGAEFE